MAKKKKAKAKKVKRAARRRPSKQHHRIEPPQGNSTLSPTAPASDVSSSAGIATGKGTASAEGLKWLLLGSEALPKLPEKPGPDPLITPEMIEKGDAFVRANPDMKQTAFFDRLRELLNTSVKNSTLWRAFYSKDAKRRRQRFSG
jgi:hypothetical protein